MVKYVGYLRKGLFVALCAITVLFGILIFYCQMLVLKIFTWHEGKVLFCYPVTAGDKIDVFWTHSLEKIPWNEYYELDGEHMLVLNTITFPAFGAGIPANNGKTRIGEDGLIYMEHIGEKFPYFKWLNSCYTREIRVNGITVARGRDLPDHQVLILRIERRGFPWMRIKNSKAM